MPKPEKRMGRAKDNPPDAQHGNREGRRRKQGGKEFYKQPAGRGWGGGASSARPLDGRKLPLNILKLIEVGGKPLSLKKKRYAIGTNLEKHLERIINL